MKLLRTLLISAAALFLAGCYDRFTANYSEFPLLSESRNAIVDETGVTDADRAKQLAYLRRLAKQPEPPYTINAGDMLEIVVYNHTDLNIKTTVTPDGFIGMVFIGQIKLAGLTLLEASQKLEEILKVYIKNPKVGVSPIKISSQTASIAGAVTHPGMYGISNGMRLTDLYAQAGGSSTRYFDGQVLDAADLQHSLFIRDGKAIPLDFFKAIEQGDPDHNLQLRKGDYIYIAVRSESMVCLIGEVNTPHKRLWDKNLGLLELLASGGHVKETYWQYAIIIRGGVANPSLYKVDLDAVLQGRAPNVMLEPGDVVYIPKDDMAEYNVFVRKLIPTAQLTNLLLPPVYTWANF